MSKLIGVRQCCEITGIILSACAIHGFMRTGVLRSYIFRYIVIHGCIEPHLLFQDPALISIIISSLGQVQSPCNVASVSSFELSLDTTQVLFYG